MFRSRPLFPTTADNRLMVWTAEAVAVREALKRGRNVLVHGPAGSGKTTVLHQAEHELRSSGRTVLFAPLRGVTDVVEIGPLLVGKAFEAGLLLDPETGLPPLGAQRGDPVLDPHRTVRRLDALPPGAIVLLDDVGPEVGYALFGRLRDELWQLPLTWGVAVDAGSAGALLSPPADAFFEATAALRELDQAERVDLVKHRAVYGAGDLSATQIEQLGTSGPGNPRRLVDYARLTAEDGVDPQLLIAAREARLKMALTAAGRDGEVLVAEMERLGPISASDETLAGRLGWPRPRIASTLTRLETAHLTRSYLEARDGRGGRPRKLYELVPEIELVR